MAEPHSALHRPDHLYLPDAQGVFNLTLRASQGLLYSLFELMNVPLCTPDYSCVSKRAHTVKMAYRKPASGRITYQVIDSSSLKVFGEGAWKVRKHGAEKRRVWHKLHLAVDPATHDIVAAEASLESVHDAEVLPTLLNPLRRMRDVFIQMASMAAKPVISLSGTKGQPPVSRLAKTRGYGKKDTQEMDAVQVMRKEGLAHWKKISGYHRRSLAETAMYRFKQLLTGKHSLRNCNDQVEEVMPYIGAINKLNTLGLPVRKPRV